MGDFILSRHIDKKLLKGQAVPQFVNHLPVSNVSGVNEANNDALYLLYA